MLPVPPNLGAADIRDNAGFLTGAASSIIEQGGTRTSSEV